ncbi:MAG: hypothetical protein ACQEQ2_01595 [Pseudomonadota bacterium]
MKRGSLADLKRVPFWSRVLGWLSIFGWLIFVVAAIVFNYAKPERNTILTEIFGISVRDYWHITLGDLFVILLVIGLLVSLLCFVLNYVLFRQDKQHLWINIMVLIMSCLGGLSLYFFGF